MKKTMIHMINMENDDIEAKFEDLRKLIDDGYDILSSVVAGEFIIFMLKNKGRDWTPRYGEAK
jgi:hypothetical protein